MDKPPKKKSAGDIGREVARAIASAIPVVGGPAQVLLENVFSAPLDKRKHAWLEQLADVITEIQQRMDGLTPEKLATNEAFVTVALQASQIAMRTHQQEKLQALRNAVLNSALPNPPEEDEQFIFLRLIDQLTRWHLRVLVMLNSPDEWMTRNGIPKPNWGAAFVSMFIEHCFPHLPGKQEFYDQIVRDLQNDGLITQGRSMRMNLVVPGEMDSRTTDRGKRFLGFVSVPRA
jgi:hypothetical protein